MNIRRASTGATIAVAAAAVATLTAIAANESVALDMQQLPDGVTSQMITSGGELFRTDALCHACHGVDGKGIANLGSDLTDGEWAHVDGSYPSIVELVNAGITAEESSSGIPMPPRAGANLSDDQVRAVAAYVWSQNQAR